MPSPLGVLPMGLTTSTTEVEEDVYDGPLGALPASSTASTNEVEEDVNGGCNTLCYISHNLSLITINSGLAMHDATSLIHSESSQRHF
jgi:hypothetical protein